MPVHVLVWDYTGVTHCGHAAVRIIHGGREAYCSWWPSTTKIKNAGKGEGPDKASPIKARGLLDRDFHTDAKAECGPDGRLPYNRFLSGELEERPGQVVLGAYANGTVEMMQHPQQNIVLPGIQDGIGQVGLDLERMLTLWNLLNVYPKRQYRLISKEYNCASIAGALLAAGGASFYSELETGEKPDLGMIWTGPNDITKWAKDIEGGIAKARKTLDFSQLASFGGTGPLVDAPDGRHEIMDLETWKQLSFVKASLANGFARRIDQIAKIDEYLRDYHLLGPWNWRNFAQCKQKIGRLAAMLREACSHVMNKKNSDRRDAVIQLASQIIARYNYVSPLYERFLRPQMLEIIEREIHVQKLV